MQLVLIMENMVYGDLSGFICDSQNDPQRRRLLEESRVSFLHDICEGLEFMHSRGYVHQDLKSDNVLVGLDLRVKVR